MMPSIPTISVVVPTYMRSALLADCLEGLRCQTRRPDEVVVVARSEDAATLAVVETERLRTASPIRTVAPASGGIVPAITAGLSSALGDVIAWTDDDAVPDFDWLLRIEQHFLVDDVVAVGGADYDPIDGLGRGGPSLENFGRLTWSGRLYGGMSEAICYVGPVGHLRGCNMAVRAPVPLPMEQLRGDGSGYEADICLQLAHRGKVLYDYRVRVAHRRAERVPEGDKLAMRPEVVGSLTSGTVDACYNLALILSRRIEGVRRVAVLLQILFIGQRSNPGLLHLMIRVCRCRNVESWRLAYEVMRVKRAGWRVGKRSRK